MMPARGSDLIWFRYFVVVVVEMAQITPPDRFNLFVIQGMTITRWEYITKAALPCFLNHVVMVFGPDLFSRHRHGFR